MMCDLINKLIIKIKGSGVISAQTQKFFFDNFLNNFLIVK